MANRTSAEDFAARTHVVAIGVGAYTSADFRDRPLNNPAKNVAHLVEVLANPRRCAVPGNQIIPIVDQQASKERILSVLKDVVTNTAEKDLVIFYFCGHGYNDGQEFYLCLPETNLTDPGKSAISGSDLQEVLNTARARGVLLILDCCYGGSFAEYAPEIFRHSSFGEFRLLLAASGATQQAWDLGEDGTAFTKHLIRVLRGEEVVSSKEPDCVYLSDLLTHSSRMMEEDRKDQYPSLPEQTPQLVGFHRVDPLLFVLRPMTLKQINLKTVRYSKAHVRLLLVRTGIALSASVLLIVGLTYTICDHLRFIKNEAGRLVLYRGYYGIHLANLPQSIRAVEWRGDQLNSDSRLAREGGVLQGTLSLQPLESLPGEIVPKYRFLVPLYRGDAETAYVEIVNSLQSQWPPTDLRDFSDPAVTAAAWLLGRKAKVSDRPLFEKAASSTHMQVSALGQAALASLDSFPSEADMRRRDIRELTYRSRLIAETYQGTCTDNALNFLRRLSQINGTYDDNYIVDALSRWGCRLKARDIFAISNEREFNAPISFGDENLAMLGASIDLEDYRQATTEALQGEPLAAKRAMLIRSLAAIPKGTCDAPFFGDLLRNRDPVVYPVAVRLVVKSCPNPLATFPGQIAPSGDVIGDLIRYNAVAPNALHSMFAEKRRQNDMIASQLILAAGSSSDPSWVPEILPFLGSTDYWARQAAFRALADLGYKGDEPEAAAANENHPLVIADAVRWVWMKDSDRGREMALKNVSALPIYSLVQMLERPSEKEEQRLFEATLVGAAPLKRNGACVLAAVLSASELTRVLNSHDLQVQDAAYGCIPFRTDAINSISGREFSFTRPDSLEFRLHRRQDLLNACNVEVARFPKWAQQWRRKLCVAWDLL